MDPRLTTREASVLHAAAVTRNYSVEPRLGKHLITAHCRSNNQLNFMRQALDAHAGVSTGCVIFFYYVP